MSVPAATPTMAARFRNAATRTPAAPTPLGARDASPGTRTPGG